MGKDKSGGSETASNKHKSIKYIGTKFLDPIKIDYTKGSRQTEPRVRPQVDEKTALPSIKPYLTQLLNVKTR